MKIEKLKKMVDVIDVVQSKRGEDPRCILTSTLLDVEIDDESAVVNCRRMRPGVVSALVDAGFSVKVTPSGASISFKSED